MTAVAKSAAPPDAERLRDLLAAYENVRAVAASVPRVVWVALGSGRIGARVRVPLPTLFLDYLLRDHVLRSATALERRYRALAAIGGAEALRPGLEALENFGRSLVPVPSRRLILGFVLAVLVVAFVLSDFVFRAQEEARATAGAIRALLTLDRGQFADTLEAVDPAEALGAALILGLSICLVLWLPAASFQIKRALLAFHPQEREALSRLSIGAIRPAGAYDLERRAFAGVGSRPPRELRFDRIFGLSLLVIPLWAVAVLAALGILGARGSIGSVDRRGGFVLLLAAGYLLLWTTSRLASLARPRRARGWARRLAAVAIATGASAAVAIVAGWNRASEPIEVVAQFQGVRVMTNVPLSEYLGRRGSQPVARRLSAQDGVVLTFGVRISAPNGSRLQSRYSIADAQSGRVSHSALGPAFSPRRQQMTGSVDARNLLLLRLSRLTSEVGSRMTSVVTRSNVWVPFSNSTGRFVLRLELYDDDARLLTSFRTTPFLVKSSSGRFRTVGRFSLATVRG